MLSDMHMHQWVIIAAVFGQQAPCRHRMQMSWSNTLWRPQLAAEDELTQS